MTKSRRDLSGSPIIVCEHVDDYRRAISIHVNSNDVVIELGCALGVTTELIGRHCKKVVGVDKSDFQFQNATIRFPNVQFFNIDAFDVSKILALDLKFNKIFIDISGNRDIGDLINLIDSYEKVFQPELFVVKSYKLKKLLQCSTVFNYQEKQQEG
eukprot:TRINITY_DN13649_c1_g1_i3.p2 TRINITY_DN13649_c1_g1~~TRINITY_DN13649_c1_g1_i3.p2  ORF type:complete len:156 (-),score=25.02 TRINITY_DN13649_c1_g1_i3:128-595(-)